MRTPRLLLANLAGAPLEAGTEVPLPPERSHYLARVLRRTPGDAVQLFDGAGRHAEAELTAHDTLRLTRAPDTDAPPALEITLGIALSRGERMDAALQKATELGVARVALLWTQRVEVKLDARRLATRLRHWAGVVASACEQCGRNRVPAVDPPQPLAQWLAATRDVPGIVLDPAGEPFGRLPAPGPALRLVTGPEGGFTVAETAAAVAAGCAPARLGPRVLRAETAPLAALAVVQYLWGDLSG